MGHITIPTDLQNIQQLPIILIFIPTTNEFQRFILSSAFHGLQKDHELHYVLPSNEANTMRTALPGFFTSINSTEINISQERFQQWVKLFNAACIHYASISPSFAIRANVLQVQFKILKFIPRIILKSILKTVQFFLKWKYWVNFLYLFFKKTEQHLVTYLENNKHNLFCKKEYKNFVDNILQKMEPLPGIVALINRFNPLYCIIPSSLLDIFCNDVVLACDKEEVACVILQSGWDNLSSKGILHHSSPFIGCWGPQSLNHAKKIQSISSELSTALGAPHYEFLKESIQDRNFIREKFNILDHETFILFGGSFRQFDETSLLRKLDDAITNGDLGPIKILYRPHPWRAAREHEDDFFKFKWKNIRFDPDMFDRYMNEQKDKGYIKKHVPMYDMCYLSKILSAVDAVVSPMSTLLVESLIMKKPTLAIAFGDNKHIYNPSVTAKMTHFAELRNSKALIWCNKKKDFLSSCKLLANSHHQYKKQDALIKSIVTLEPETYSERLAKFCRNIVEPRARKLRNLRAMHKRLTISHAYGANIIAKNYCEIKNSAPIIPGYWMHGWIPAYHNVHPLFIALHKKNKQHIGYNYQLQIHEDKENIEQWVGRSDQAEFLINHGYRKVKAIGLPFIYLPKSIAHRVPNSLLVMPPHSHKNHGPDDYVAKEYAEFIADLKSYFEFIFVGLNEDDIAKRQWIDSFQKMNIQVFTTTDQAHPNTLMRLKDILSTFEYVTTNGYGSHIALAAYCGAKLSIAGPYADFPLERMKTTHAVKMAPHLLHTAYDLCTERALKANYPFLFVEPHKAVTLQSWGAHEVGESCKLDPKDLGNIFQWHENTVE